MFRWKFSTGDAQHWLCLALVAFGEYMVLTDGLCKCLDGVDKSKASPIDLQHVITSVKSGSQTVSVHAEYQRRPKVRHEANLS